MTKPVNKMASLPQVSDRELLEMIWSKMSELAAEFNKITDEITKITAKMIDFEERLDQAENTTTDLQNGLGLLRLNIKHRRLIWNM